MTAVDVGGPGGTRTASVAREILAFATGGTLHVRGIDDDDPAPAGLGADATFYDEDGVPTFAATAASPLALAARTNRGAVLAIPADDGTGFTQLVLGGHLSVLGDESPHAVSGDIVAIGLLVHTVVLERDTGTSTVGYRAVGLDAWTAARPDPLRPAARRLLAHANGHHGGDLREWAAGRHGLPTSDVLAAEVITLDADGITVCWLDERGAHEARVRFPHRAGCPGALAAALRDTFDHR